VSFFSSFFYRSSFFLSFFFSSSAAPPDLHSFPTRRSSDLPSRRAVEIIDPKASDPELGSVIAQAPILSSVRRSRAHRSCWAGVRSEEHTSELQSLAYLVCRLLLEKKKKKKIKINQKKNSIK